MNNQLKHLPPDKQTELHKLTEVLKTCKGVEMVILFGSYARGTWVEDMYTEKGTVYEYKSDYDLLIVTTHDDFSKNQKIEKRITENTAGEVQTPISLIFHSVKHLNQALTMGNYFFKDIKKEGIVLYDTQKFKLQNPKKLTTEEAKQKAQAYFDQWFTSANEFLIDFNNALSRKSYNNAAFLLHQATERYYTTILLVFTDYRPKEHDLERLDSRVINCNRRFNVFPKTTKEQQQRFKLLQRAYIDARYNMDDYQITKQDLEYLAKRVGVLKALTQEICTAKILEIGQ